MTRSNWAPWAVGLLLVGCGEQSIEPVKGGPSDGGVGGSSGATAGGTGGSAVAGGGTSTGGTGGGATDGGGAGGTAGGGGTPFEPPLLAAASQFQLATGPWGSVLFASFTQPDPTKRCYSYEVDTCLVTDCRSSKFGSQKSPWASVGPVTFSDGAGTSKVLSPSSSNYYPKSEASGTWWPPGNEVTISAPGAELPGFNVDLVMPAAVDMLSPDIESAADNEIYVKRTQPFSVTWAPTAGDVAVELYEGPITDATAQDFLDVMCKFPGASGSAQIPVQLLSLFEGSQPVTGLVLGSVQRVEQAVGTRTLWALATNVVQRRVVIE